MKIARKNICEMAVIFFRILARSCCLPNKSQGDLDHQFPLPLLLPSYIIQKKTFPGILSKQLS